MLTNVPKSYFHKQLQEKLHLDDLWYTTNVLDLSGFFSQSTMPLNPIITIEL